MAKKTRPVPSRLSIPRPLQGQATLLRKRCLQHQRYRAKIETEDKDAGKVDDDMDDEAVEDEDKEKGSVDELEELEALQQQNHNTPRRRSRAGSASVARTRPPASKPSSSDICQQ